MEPRPLVRIGNCGKVVTIVVLTISTVFSLPEIPFLVTTSAALLGVVHLAFAVIPWQWQWPNVRYLVGLWLSVNLDFANYMWACIRSEYVPIRPGHFVLFFATLILGFCGFGLISTCNPGDWRMWRRDNRKNP
ncbi:MAG: hypothetical protein JST40_13365 [Armatimonadetes bacterium]|nr:hypothetical protein [Armatimonadota bacterium]